MIKDMNFPCGLLTKTLRFHCRGCGFDPCWGTEILHALWHSQKKKKKIKNTSHNWQFAGSFVKDLGIYKKMISFHLLLKQSERIENCLVCKAKIQIDCFGFKVHLHINHLNNSTWLRWVINSFQLWGIIYNWQTAYLLYLQESAWPAWFSCQKSQMNNRFALSNFPNFLQ